jgi:DNA-binding response OmpR family regulator
MKILLVDDEEEFVSTLAERLVMRGIEAVWTTTSFNAIERVESDFFDLAVLDVRMPSIGGFALKEKLQARQPRMKFIFLTGYGSEEDFHSIASYLGEEFYLVKPVDIEALIAKMEEVLHGQGVES